MEGHAFCAAAPKAFTGPYDSAASPRASRLVLYEDGCLLGPRHSVFELIAGEGGGRYSHFLGQVNFSASDGSDPNTNGRAYTFAVGEPSPVTAGLGGCHMNLVVRSLYRRGWLDMRGIDMGVAYSPLEQLRLVERQLGLRREPEALASLAVSTVPEAKALLTPEDRIDLLLVEITSQVNTLLGDVCLNRSNVMSEILGRSGSLGREIFGHVSRWHSQILKCDDEARESAACEVLSRIGGTSLDTPTLRLAFQEARGVRETPAEMTERLAAIRDLLQPQRMLLIRGPNVFFPDGRSINWGSNLIEDMVEVAALLEVPLIDIGRIVQERGFADSVLPDMIHHTDAFIDHLGQEVLKTVEAFYGPWPWPEGTPKPLSRTFVR